MAYNNGLLKFQWINQTYKNKNLLYGTIIERISKTQFKNKNFIDNNKYIKSFSYYTIWISTFISWLLSTIQL